MSERAIYEIPATIRVIADDTNDARDQAELLAREVASGDFTLVVSDDTPEPVEEA